MGEGDPVGVFNNVSLFLSYTGGGGNDLLLYSLSIPEPSRTLLLCFATVALLVRRRRPAIF